MLRLVKTDVDELTLFIINEQFAANKIVFYQPSKDDDEWSLIKEQEYKSDVVAYSIKDINKFNREIDIQDYKIQFKQDDNIVYEIVLPVNNSSEPSWKRGILKQHRYEFLIKAKKINGNKLLIFKKLKSQEHCPLCWDDDLQSSNNTNCPMCGGTGYVIKYSKPFFTWGGPYINQPTAYPKGREDGQDLYNPQFGNQGSISLLPDIPIDMYDLIYVVDIGELNLITNITNTYFSNILLSQSATIVSLPTASREYKAVEQDLKEKLKELYGVS